MYRARILLFAVAASLPLSMMAHAQTPCINCPGSATNVSPSNAIIGSITGLAGPEWNNAIGNYVYQSGDNMGLAIIDVSVPTGPRIVGTARAGYSAFGNWATPPYVYLALAGYFNGVSTVGGLVVLDVSDPANPIELGTAISTTGHGSEGTVSKGNFVYIANQVSSSVDVYDVTTKTAPTYVTSLHDAVNLALIQTVYLNGNYLYLPTASGITVVDITTQDAPTIQREVAFGNAQGGMAFSGTHAFVSNNDNGILTTLDISTASAPTVVASLYDQRLLFGSNPAIIGDYVYVPSFNTPGAITAVNVSDPLKPYVVSGIIGKTPGDLLDATSACTANGVRYIYCATGFLGTGGEAFLVVDTNALIAPALIPPNQVGTPGPIFSHATTQLYACSSDSILAIAGVSDALALVPGTAYVVSAGAGSVTTNVQCTLTGSTYGWKTM